MKISLSLIALVPAVLLGAVDAALAADKAAPRRARRRRGPLTRHPPS